MDDDVVPLELLHARMVPRFDPVLNLSLTLYGLAACRDLWRRGRRAATLSRAVHQGRHGREHHHWRDQLCVQGAQADVHQAQEAAQGADN